MSEGSDYDAGVWKGVHDFASAKRAYDSHAGRSYTAAVSSGKTVKDLICQDLSTDSTAPLIIFVDETGSMSDWPGTIFSKLPYLEHEGKEYLGDDFEICFGAFGDAHCNEDYPLQARPFAKGLELKDRIQELVIEGGGGGQMTESSELAAFFAAEKIKIPKAIKPILIFISDEMSYNTVDKDQAKKYLGITLEKTLTTKAVFEKLKQKYAVYFIHKSYDGGSANKMSANDQKVYDFWADLVGADHIAPLPTADRVVDVIFGILAKETGRIAYFEEELEDRQLKDVDGKKKIDIVYKSLATIHNTPDTKHSIGGKSVMHKTMKKLSNGSSKSIKPLI